MLVFSGHGRVAALGEALSGAVRLSPRTRSRPRNGIRTVWTKEQSHGRKKDRPEVHAQEARRKEGRANEDPREGRCSEEARQEEGCANEDSREEGRAEEARREEGRTNEDPREEGRAEENCANEEDPGEEGGCEEGNREEKRKRSAVWTKAARRWQGQATRKAKGEGEAKEEAIAYASKPSVIDWETRGMAALNATEGLGVGQWRRILLPGFVASVGLHPFLSLALLQDLGELYGATSTALFAIEVVLLGLLITASIEPIFRIYEGFLLPWLTLPARLWNEHRVTNSQQRLQKLYGSDPKRWEFAAKDARVIEIEEFLDDFPVREEGGTYVYEVERTTRLGNIIATYELYPGRRYGVDGVFYWFHLAHLAPEASREDFQENATSAESIVLASAAGGLVALVAGSVLLGYGLGGLCPSLVLVEAPVSQASAWASLAFGLASCLIFYRMSWAAHRAVGRAFRALVDLAMPEFQAWVDKSPIPPPKTLERRAARMKKYLETLDPNGEQVGQGEETEEPSL